MQQSLTANPHELAEAFRQIGNGFSRLAKALDEREDVPLSSRELEYVPLEEVEQPTARQAAKTPRAALKAVPKAAPVVEAETVIERTQAEEKPYTQAEAEEESAMVQALQDDDPLPEFTQREQEESPEEIEADRQNIIAAIKLITLQFRTEPEFEQWMADSDAGNQTRGWLRTMLEKAQAKALKVAEATAPVAITNPKDAPAQPPDGRQKKARQDESGTEFATYVHPNDAAPGPYKLAYDRFHSIFEEWRAKGQDYGTVRDKVEASVHNKRFKNFGELDAADLARATHALNNWNPEADASLAKKETKK